MERQNSEAIWREALALIAGQVNQGTYRIWFEPTVGLGFDGDVFVIGVASEFAKDWIDTRFLALIGDAVSEVVGESVGCRVVVSAEAAGDDAQPAIEEEAFRSTSAPNPHRARQDGAPGAPGSVSSPDRPPGLKPSSPYMAVGLNEKYTFESFVIGPSNRFAHAAALAAAESPGTQYNPLFIYGGVGLGKTHLLQAIAHYVIRQSPELRVKFVTIEMFTNDFINSLRDETIEGFKRRYRQNDLLLIDDIQFLEKKEQTQEEFFHTFNALYEAGKQIVICCDRPPKALQTLEDRLVSRFEQGLITDIQPPDLETRIAILRKKVRLEGIRLADDEVLSFIASRVPSNIRELEGCLTRVVAFSSFSGRAIDADLAHEVLKDIPEIAETRITIDLILNVVASTLGVSVTEIKGDKRSRAIVDARHIAMYLARELTDASLPKIGERMGGKDHTTVMHGVGRITKQLGENRQTYNLIQELTTKIKSARG